MSNTGNRNKASASQFIEIFNTDDWDAIGEVVAEHFVLTHPLAGTIQLGPKGMAAAWSGDKKSVPDMWHPIPVMITEGDHLAVADEAFAAYNQALEPKRLVVLPGGHFDAYTGAGFEAASSAARDWFVQWLQPVPVATAARA